jgi:hypothetical protein
MVLSSLPDVSNWKIGFTFALSPAQVVPPAPEMPHRSVTQIVPSGAVVTLAVDPHLLPSGNCPQLTPARYGLGRSLRAPSSDADGSFTGYCPAGKTGVPLRPPAPPPPAALAEAGGTPQESASGPGDPSRACALSLPAPAVSTSIPTIARTALPDSGRLNFTRLEPAIATSSR